MQQQLKIEQFPNGFTLLGEPMPWLRSTAFSLLVGSGTAKEPASMLGLAGITLEMAQRGAGSRDSRAIVESLDYLGVDRSSSVSTFHSFFSAAMLSEALHPTLEIYADIVQRPHLPEEELDDSKQGALQELRALEDDPAHRCLTEIKKARFSEPYGRSAYGTQEGVHEIALEDVQKNIDSDYIPEGAILAVAGNFEWDALRREVEKLFGGWKGKSTLKLPELKIQTGTTHIQHDSSQTHIALAYRSMPYNHPDYYQARGLVGVLSDGMSSRLFSEVREKRGLVYTVSASSHSLAGRGSVLCYAGTTTERAQETLNVTIQTIQSLADGITDGELSRLKTRVRTSLIMEQESSMARSSQIASDWYLLGRVPERSEVSARIEALTCESLVEHYRKNPATEWTLVTLGNQALELPHGI